MHKFQGKQSLPKLNNEEIVCLNRTTSIKEIESVIKNLPTNKSPELGDFTGEFHQTFEEELISIIFKIYQKIEEEGTLSNAFYQVSLTTKPKPKILQENKMTD